MPDGFLRCISTTGDGSGVTLRLHLSTLMPGGEQPVVSRNCSPGPDTLAIASHSKALR
jgi:hypothetical protein